MKRTIGRWAVALVALGVGLALWWGRTDGAGAQPETLKTHVGRANRVPRAFAPRKAAGRTLGGAPRKAAGRTLGGAPKAAAGKSAAPTVQPQRDPGGKLVAFRRAVLPPLKKGEAAGELREWLVRPKEGYTTHLEEHWRPGAAGVPALVETREYVANQVLLVLDARTPWTWLRDALAPAGVTVKEPLMTLEKGGCIVAVHSKNVAFETVAELMDLVHAADPRLAPECDIILYATRTPSDPRMGSLWGMKQIQAPEAWDLATDATNVLVAVVDTGVNYFHEDLTDNVVRDRENLPFPWVRGVNFVGGAASNDPMDDNGHGTHCAGTVCARGNNGKGVAGVAWNARLVPVKAGNSEGKFSISAIVNSYHWARQHGVGILSCSFGGYGGSGAMESAIRHLQIMDVILACAAGNGGDDGVGDDNDKLPHYPSSYPWDNIVAVASTGKGDVLSGFSNYGIESVDVAAPGEEILSTAISDRGGVFASTADQDTGYEFLQGTSMATPHVAGALALIKGTYPDDVYWQTIQRLTLNGDYVEDLREKVATGTRINVYKAILSLIPPAPVVTASPGTYEDRVEVAWKPVKGATYYKLYRRWSEGGPMDELTGWTTDLAYTDRAAEPKVGYHYYVRSSKHADGHDASPLSPAGVGYKYTPIMDEWDPADDIAEGATVITPTAEVQTHGIHSLTPRDAEDWFRIAVQAGHTYLFESTGAYDLRADLYRAATTNETDLLTWDDDSGADNNFRLFWVPDEDGQVFLRVRKFDAAGDAWYTLQHSIVGWTDAWDPADDTAAGATALVPTAEEQAHGLHSLSGSDAADHFKLELAAGRTYVFATSGDTDTFLELYRGALDAGSLVAWNDDGMDTRFGSELNARLVFKPAESGTYYLRAKLAPSGGVAGTYSLVYVEAPETCDVVYSTDALVKSVKGWSANGIVVASADGVTGERSFTTGAPLFVKWAFNETNFTALATAVTNLVELLNLEGKRLAWGHAVCPGLGADEFYDFTTELPVLPAGAYQLRVTLNSDVRGNPSVREAATADNVRTCPFTLADAGKTVVGLEIEGPSTLASKGAGRYRCVAHYADETTAEVTPAWSVPAGGDLAVAGQDGTVSVGIVPAPGAFTLRAVYGGQIATREVALTPLAASEESAFPEPVTYPTAVMKIQIKVKINGLRADPGDKVAVYAGGEVRGLVKINSGSHTTINVSVAYPGEVLAFKVWDASAGAMLNCAQTLYGQPGRTYATLELTCSTDDPFGSPKVSGSWAEDWRAARIRARVTVNGLPASDGDVLAVYAGATLVGKQVISLSTGFGDVETTADCDVEAYLEEEAELNFLLWDRHAGKLRASTSRATLAPGGTLGTEEEPFPVETGDETRLTVRLPQAGWHLVSFNVLPADAKPGAVFRDFEQGSVTAVRFGGETWRPGEPDGGFEVKLGAAYWVEAGEGGAVWTVSGTGNPDVSIPLKAGWNLVGYPLPRAGRVVDVLHTALARQAVTEVAGAVANFPGGSLAMLQPSEGYQVYAPQATLLTFDRTGMLTAGAGSRAYGPFGDGEDVVRDPQDPVRYVDARVRFGAVPAAFGDCVGVYDAANRLRGVGRVENEAGTASFPVYAAAGTVLHARVWNSAAGEADETTYPAAQTFTAPAAGARVENLELTVALKSGAESGGEPGAPDAAPATFTVTFDLGAHGTRTGGGELVQQVALGGAAVAPAVACAAGWRFEAWDAPLTDVRAARTVKAIYREGAAAPVPPAPVPPPPPPTVKLAFDANGGVGEMAEQTFEFERSGSTVQENAFTREGHTFLGWSASKDGPVQIADAGGAAGVAEAVGRPKEGESAPTTLYAVWGFNGYKVGVGTLVANGGTRVKVPVTINTARPLACAGVRIAFDPNILVYAGVERDAASAVFDDDFLVTRPAEGSLALGFYATKDVVAGAGVLAWVAFDVRPGTEGQFSDVSVTDVQLADSTGVRDVTANDPLAAESGMVRVMASDAAVTRLENEQTVHGETSLGVLDLLAGDEVAASPNRLPVRIAGGVNNADGQPVRVRPPVGGWKGGRYQLLSTPTAGLTLQVADAPARTAFVVTEERVGGVSLYQLEFGTPADYTVVDDATGDGRNLHVSNDLLVALGVENPSPSAVSAALERRSPNGLKAWQNYVLGLGGSEPSRILLRAPRTAAKSRIRLSADLRPVKDAGVKAQFRLQKSVDGGATWMDIGTVNDTPDFDLDATADLSGLYRLRTVFTEQAK